MHKYISAPLILVLLAGCTPEAKECRHIISSCDDVKLNVALSATREGERVYATIVVKNDGDVDIDVPKYILAQPHDEDARGFLVSMGSRRLQMGGRRYEYTTDFRNKCITLRKEQSMEFTWRLDESFDFTTKGVYEIQYWPMVSFGSGVFCRIESNKCKLKVE